MKTTLEDVLFPEDAVEGFPWRTRAEGRPDRDAYWFEDFRALAVWAVANKPERFALFWFLESGTPVYAVVELEDRTDAESSHSPAWSTVQCESPALEAGSFSE